MAPCYNRSMRIPGWMQAAAVLAALCLNLLPTLPGQAQAPLQIDLAPPDASAFPEIVLYVTARLFPGDETPIFAPQDFVILEDQVERPLTALEIVQSGVDLRLVVNSTRGLGVRDASGRSRFDRVAEALVAWLSRPQAAPLGDDRYTLITRAGTLLEGVPAAAELAAAIDYLEPELSAADTALDLLTRALEDRGPAPPSGTPGVLLFVTPFVNVAEDLQLANVIAAAQQQSTAIFPILVGHPALAEEPGLETWRTLAEQTGGSLVLFDPQTGLDPLSQQLDRLRGSYRLTYESAASSQGAHTVQVRVVNETTDETSPVRTFRAEVLQPEVVFVSPPSRVSLEPPRPGQGAAGAEPPTLTLPLLITCPDGHPRPIVAAELLVDGVLAVSQVQTPFDSLTWSMAPDTRPGEVTLQAAVTDSLGLRGLSEPLTLRLETRRAPGLLETRPWLIGLLVGSVIAMAAAIGLMTRFGTRPPPAVPASRRPRLRRASLAPASPDQAEAQLQSLEADLDPILLTGTDVTLGRDASLVTHVLLDPSVSAVHARLIRQVSGRYLLRDQDSAAGTWVNHQPVAQAGRTLEHGDLVHFGRVGYRFLESAEPEPRQIRVESPVDCGPTPA
jgi:hypothetical protein